MTPTDAETIRHRALRALAGNRVPGYHFAGHFLDLQCRRYDRGGVLFDMDAGPHCAGADGTVDLAAVVFLADMALASSARVFVDPTARTATLLLRIEFTGVAARGQLTAEAHSDG
ncbi:MAG TPA: hypothetical protein VMK05_08755, partial [Burkholderiales bacterium]|nr:hypothetical protein [Burkholderiales bacterium]